MKIDKKSVLAYYRRARAYAIPINAGVEEYEKSVKDLKTVLKLIEEERKSPGTLEVTETNLNSLQKACNKFIAALDEKIKINRKREYETYGKMFTKQAKVADYVEQQKKPVKNPKTSAELEKENELKMIEKISKKYIASKKLEFQF